MKNKEKTTKIVLTVLIITAITIAITIFAILMKQFGCAPPSIDGYKMATYVQYTTAGTIKTESSRALPILEKTYTPSTATEFNSVDKKYRFDYNTFYDGILLNSSKTTINSYYGLTENDIGCTIIWHNNIDNYNYYGKVPFKGWDYLYIYVKVIDNETIAIHYGNEETATTYKVTSYRIVYFDNQK